MYHAPPQLRIINFFYNEDRYEKMFCVDYVKSSKFNITFLYKIEKNRRTITFLKKIKAYEIFEF